MALTLKDKLAPFIDEVAESLSNVADREWFISVSVKYWNIPSTTKTVYAVMVG